jgi:glycosyltransferase involved in cell wall biosynthesis
MKISILTPTLNCRKTITETALSIISVIEKNNVEIEWLIGDGGSTDGTLECVKNIEKLRNFVKIYIRPDLNLPETLNNLIKISNGDFIHVLNGDDFIHEENYCKLIANLNLNFDIVSGSIAILNESGDERLGERLSDLSAINRYMSLNHPAMLVKRSVFDVVGLFPEKYPTSYDYLWVWSSSKKKIKFQIVDQIISYMRLGGVSQKRALKASFEIFLYKCKSGYLLSALSGFIIFIIKHTLKNMCSEKLMKVMKRVYRDSFGSIDKY